MPVAIYIFFWLRQGIRQKISSRRCVHVVRAVCCITGVCVYKLISVLVGSMSSSKAAGAMKLCSIHK